MCLANVDEKPKRKYGIGYKAVRKTNDGRYLCADHIPTSGSVEYPLDTWIEDPRDGEASGNGDYGAGYRTGFHLCLDGCSFAANLSWTVIKLRFKAVTATGSSGPYGKQVVARKVCNIGEETGGV